MSLLFDLLANVIQLYIIVLLIRILITWIPNLDPYNPLVQILNQVTEPVLEPARRLIPPIGMIDISPIVVFFVLQILVSVLHDLAGRV
ncbi:MAG: YggT family protein [Caldilineaceae bacterium]|nr:YggT family protein [Caldilineaceae bacterium]MCB0159813.1 YggT family protein [Caldilineaceae bacterium]